MTGDVGKLYAQALFELGLEAGNLDEIYGDMNECRKIFDENPELVSLLDSPVILREEKQNVLDKIFGTEGTVRDFICLVTDKNRITYFGKMTDLFNQLYNDHNNIAEMTVITSIPLKPEARQKLVKKLEVQSGKTVKLKEEVDPSIIGGIILRVGNSQIDNSVKGKIEAIASSLKIQ
ncbi:MAG: F0F1 ATP synthase subunit delta [Ruminococcus sp.]|nr:F0F1 ATP synthase subunit delta [Ruminococcus sp.]MBQ8434503.1 F0F1 ATP synthase subunit delta [Oscillospiraceae bacterium]